MSKLKSNEFRCEACGGVFEEGGTEEKALAEYRKAFGALPDELIERKAKVCDDCYRKIIAKISQ